MCLHCCCQGSTKRLSRLSEITETPISHGNFSFWKQLFATENVPRTETSLCHRKEFRSQTKLSVKDRRFCPGKEFLSEKRKNFFLPEKDASVTKKVSLFLSWIQTKKITHFHGTFNKYENEITEDKYFAEPWRSPSNLLGACGFFLSFIQCRG